MIISRQLYMFGSFSKIHINEINFVENKHQAIIKVRISMNWNLYASQSNFIYFTLPLAKGSTL